MATKLPNDAFDYYVSLGPGRSYETVAEQYGVSKRTVTKRASREGWQKRLTDLEAQARHNAEQRTLESLEEMNVRHLKSLRVIQARALEALRNMPLATAMEAVRSLDLAIRQERLVRGEPSDRTSVSVEEVIRREYDRWMVTEPSGEDEEHADADDEGS